MSFTHEAREIYRALTGKSFALPVLTPLPDYDPEQRVPDAGWLDAEAKQTPDPHGIWAAGSPALRRGPNGILLDATNSIRADIYETRRGCLLIGELQATATKIVQPESPKVEQVTPPAAPEVATPNKDDAPASLDEARKKKVRT